MKTFFLTGFILLTIQFSFSQTSYPIPDFNDKPMFYNKEAKALDKLERQTAKQKVKGGVFKASGYYYFNNANSSFRVKNSDEILFIFLPAEPNIEIESQLVLYKYEVDEKKNQRLLKIATAKLTKNETIDNNIVYDYKKLNSGAYLVSVEGLDSGGEYGWATSKSTHLFGVD